MMMVASFGPITDHQKNYDSFFSWSSVFILMGFSNTTFSVREILNVNDRG
jgi:hypothetical protein